MPRFILIILTFTLVYIALNMVKNYLALKKKNQQKYLIPYLPIVAGVVMEKKYN